MASERQINANRRNAKKSTGIRWDWLDDEIPDRFSDDGRPATEIQFMIGVLLLKPIYGLSNEWDFERYLYDLYFCHRISGAEAEVDVVRGAPNFAS